VALALQFVQPTPRPEHQVDLPWFVTKTAISMLQWTMVILCAPPTHAMEL
jgi:hypothetical protein